VGHSKCQAKGIIAISAYIKKTETSQINNVIMHFKIPRKIKTNQTQNPQVEKNNKDQG
jgi:hypothetical protein